MLCKQLSAVCTLICQHSHAALLEEMEAMAEQLDEALLSLQSAQGRAETAEVTTSSLQSQLTQLQVIA